MAAPALINAPRSIALSLPLLLLLLLAACRSGAHAAQLPPLPLSTRGRHIVDARGARVRLRCASWSGAQEKFMVPSGLWARDRVAIARMAASIGLNCLRIVWSLDAVAASGVALGSNGAAGAGAGARRAVPEAAVKANPDLIGKTPLEVLDAVVAAASDAVSITGGFSFC